MKKKYEHIVHCNTCLYRKGNNTDSIYKCPYCIAGSLYKMDNKK